MPREENLLILKMLQDGSITAEQAAELLAALEKSEAPVETVETVAPVAMTNTIPLPPNLPEALRPPAPEPPTPPMPPIPPANPTPPDNDIFAKAKERIASAREKMAHVQEKLAAAEERVNKAEGTANPMESLSDALKDVPGAKAVSDALRDPGRLASTLRRQTRKVGRQVRSSLDDLNIDLHFNLAERMQGEPTVSVPREAAAPVPPGGMLRVRNTLGDIEAIGADVPEARVAGTLKIWATEKEAAETLADQIVLTIEQSDNGPTVAVSAPPNLRRVRLNLKVFVPQNGTRVSLLSPSGDVSLRGVKSGAVLATQSGDIKASEVAGDVAAETASGDIALEGIAGNVTMSSSSGDIQALRITGQRLKAVSQSGDVSVREGNIPIVNVETVSGDAQVENLSGRTLKVRAVSGDVIAKATDFTDELHLDTVSGTVAVAPRGPLGKALLTLATISGNVNLTLPTSADARLDITTKSGEVRTRFRAGSGESAMEKHVEQSGMVNLSDTIGASNDAQITISSVSGDITVAQEDEKTEASKEDA